MHYFLQPIVFILHVIPWIEYLKLKLFLKNYAVKLDFRHDPRKASQPTVTGCSQALGVVRSIPVAQSITSHGSEHIYWDIFASLDYRGTLKLYTCVYRSYCWLVSNPLQHSYLFRTPGNWWQRTGCGTVANMSFLNECWYNHTRGPHYCKNILAGWLL